jgi:hypothetical protein
LREVVRVLASAEMRAQPPNVGLRVTHEKLKGSAIAVARLEREASHSIHQTKSYQTLPRGGTLRA